MKLEMIRSDQIRPAPWQPRDTFPKDEIEELSNSLAGVGLIQPIVVRKKGKTYQITAGERRWRAWKNDFGMIPCIVREEDDTDAKITSVVENWQREAVDESQNERFLAKLYEEGTKEGKWKSVADMARRTGIGQRTLDAIVTAHTDREELGVTRTSNISWADMKETRPLKDEPHIRKKVLDKRAKKELTQPELRQYVKTLKKAPEPVKKAIIEDKVDFNDAKELIETGIPEDMEKETAQELERMKKDREAIREHEIETAKDVLEGTLKATEIRIDVERDERLYRDFEGVSMKVNAWRPFHFERIKSEKWKEKAVECVRKIRDSAEALLQTIE